MSGMTYYQRNRDMVLNRANDYYENVKERLRVQVRDKSRNLSEEYKNNKKKNMEKTNITTCLKKKTKN